MSIISKLNKAFDSRVRLGIMSLLIVNDWLEYKYLKEKLELTDGNLASHINALEKLNYIIVKKAFVGKKTNTSYQITPLGRQAFEEHLQALEQIIKS
ncbi:MAG: transcriptional regulator [Crocinitomicaceae bacterium]